MIAVAFLAGAFLAGAALGGLADTGPARGRTIGGTIPPPIPPTATLLTTRHRSTNPTTPHASTLGSLGTATVTTSRDLRLNVASRPCEPIG